MFEKVVSNILLQYLEQYVTNLNAKSIHIPLFSEKAVTLTNLLLKPFALDNIDPNIPVVISYGILGSLKIKIPWSQLQKSPVVCELTDVYCVLKPKKSVIWDRHIEEKNQNELKQQILKNFEMKRKIAQENEKSTKSNSKQEVGLFDKILETIVNNLHVHVNGVHIRYEDAITIPQHPIVVGCFLEKLYVKSTDEKWNETFVKEIQNLTYKLVTMDNFAIYVNNNEKKEDLICNMDEITPEKVIPLLRNSITNNNFQYVMNPISGNLKLKMQKLTRSIDLSKPQFDAEVCFDNISVEIDDRQYRNLVNLLEYFTNYPQMERYRQYRPAKSIKQDKKAWWKYAGSCILDNLRRQKISWKKLKQRRMDRHTYIKLYKRFVGVPWEEKFNQSDERLMSVIEAKWPASDLIFFRRLAIAEIDEEEKLHADWKKDQKKNVLFAWGINSSVIPPGVIKLTNDQKAELYKSVGFDSDSRIETPTSYVKASITFRLCGGTISLKTTKNTIICQTYFDNMLSSIQLKEQSFKCSISVGDITLLNKSNPQTKFPQIIGKRPSSSGPPSDLLSVVVEKNEPGSKTDYLIDVKLARVDIIISLKLMQSILNFLKFDDVNFTNLERIAEKQIKKASTIAREEIKLALENKKTFNISFDVMAPSIVFPLEESNIETKYILADFGHLKLVSDADAHRKERVVAEKIKEEDYFDRFQLSLSDIQVLTPNLSFHNYVLQQEMISDIEILNHVVEKVSCKVTVMKSIVPSLESINLFNITSEIPSVSVRFSPEKFEVFTDLVNQFLAFIDDPTGTSKSAVKLSAMMNVRAPVTNNIWKHCFAELKSTRKIYIHDSKKKTKLYGIILLGRDTTISVGSNDLEMTITFPYQKQLVSFDFRFFNENDKKAWVNYSKEMLLSAKTSFNVGNFAKMIVSSSVEIEKNLITTKSSQQTLLNASLMLKQLSVFIHNKQLSKPIFNMVFSDLLSTITHRAFDTSAKLNLKMLNVTDLTSHCKMSKLLATREDQQSLAEMSLLIAKEKSPLFSKDSLMQVNFSFHSVDICVQPLLISHVVKLGYDLRDVFDRIDKRHDIFAAFKTLHYKALLSSLMQSASVRQANEQKQALTPDQYPSLVKCSSSLGPSSLKLMNNDVEIAEMTASGAKVDMKLGLDQFEVTGQMGNYIVFDKITKDTLYTEILGLKNKEESSLVLFSYVHKFNSQKKIAFNKSLRVNMRSVRYVHIQRFSKSLAHYFRGPINEAIQQEKIRTVASKTIENIKEFAESQLSNLIKTEIIDYDIELMSPEVIVPAHYKSNHYAVASLGSLTIKNSLDELAFQRTYDIKLAKMYLSSFIDEGPQSEPIQVLNDVDVVVKATQNLDETITPIFQVKIDFSHLNFSISQQQYQFIFDILDGNIKDGLFDKQFLQSIRTLSSSNENIELVSTNNQEIIDGINPEEMEVGNPAETVVISDVTVNIPEMNVTMLRENGKTLDGNENCFVRLHIKHLSVSNLFFSDTSSKVEAKLKIVRAVDMRNETQNQFVVIFDSRSGKTEKEDWIKFIFRQDARKEQFCELYLSDPRIIFVPDIVLEFKNFFSNRYHVESLATAGSNAESDIEIAAIELLSPGNQKARPITVMANFGKTEIVFPEDSTTTKCRILVLESALDFQYRRDLEKEEGKINVHGVTAYIKHNESHSKGTAIVEPIAIHISLSSVIREYPHRKIKIEVVEGGKARVSYTDIKLLMTILKNFKETQLEKVVTVKNEDMTSSSSSDDISSVTSDQSISSVSKMNALLPLEFFELGLHFSSKNELSILVVDDISGNDVPLFSITSTELIAGAVIVRSEESSISASFKFILCANYFNFKIAEWEPILERTSPIEIVYQRRNSNIDSQNPVDIIKMSVDVFNVNITRSMIDTTMRTAKLWIKGLQSPAFVTPTKFEPYCIRNESGIRVKFRREMDNQEVYREIAKGETISFDFPSSTRENHLNFEKNHIYVLVENIEKKILVSKVKQYMFHLGPKLLPLCFQIELVEGRKIITIHSGTKIHNISSITWSVGCYLPVSRADEKPKVVVFSSLKPDETVYVPCKYIQQDGEFCIKPEGNQFKWSGKKKEFSFSSLVSVTSNRMLHCKSLDEDNGVIMNCITRVRRHSQFGGNSNKKLKRLSCIELMAPLALENLLPYDMEVILFTPSTVGQSLTGIISDTIKRNDKKYIYTINMREPINMRAKVKHGWNCKEYPLIYSLDSTSHLNNTFRNTDEKGRVLPLKLDYCVTGKAYHEVSIYCSYWIVNLTSKDITVHVGDDIAPGYNTLNAARQNNIREANSESQIAHLPLMFDYSTSSVLYSNKINILVDNTYHSNPFSIDNAGAQNEIDIQSETSKSSIGMFVELGPGKYQRTKIVTFVPRHIIINNTEEVLAVRQQETNETIHINPGSSKHYYHPKKTSQCLLECKLESSDWSSPFRASSLNETSLILRPKTSEGNLSFIVVQCNQERGSVHVSITKTKYPPYIIQNNTSQIIEICQGGTNQWITCNPKTRIPYSWANQEGRHILMVRVQNKSATSVEIDIVSTEHLLHDKENNKTYYIRVTAEGLSRIMKFSEERLQRQRRGSTVALPKQEDFKFQFFVLLHGIGISLIDDEPRELLYSFIEKVTFKLNFSSNNAYMEARVKRIQIDNQLPHAIFPVAFTNSVKLDEGKDFIHFSVIKSLKEASYDLYPYFSLLIQEADLSVDIDVVNRMVNYFNNLGNSNDGEEETANVNRILSGTISGTEMQRSELKKIYFRLFQLHPIKFNFSFVWDGSPLSTHQDIKKNPAILTLQTLGAHLNANIDEVQIKLNALILEHPFMSKAALKEAVSKHYAGHAITELYKIIGSFDFIGNPIGLVNDIDHGVYDLFYEPMEAITKSPEDFAKGLAKGSISFLKHSIHGTFNTASKVTESIGNSLSRLAMDNEYVMNRQQKHRKKARHIGEGLLTGAEALTSGIMDGATGLFTKPFEGIQKEGVSGFFSGMVKGVVGIPVKPVTAMFDFASKATEGIRNTTTYFDRDEKSRIRKPRVFGPDGKVIPYDEHCAVGQEIFYDLAQSKLFARSNSEVYIYHSFIYQSQSFALISSHRMMLLTMTTGTLEWKHSFKDIESVDSINLAFQEQSVLSNNNPHISETSLQVNDKKTNETITTTTTSSTSSSSTNNNITTIHQNRNKEDTLEQQPFGIVLKLTENAQKQQKVSWWSSPITERRIMSSIIEDEQPLKQLYSHIVSILLQKKDINDGDCDDESDDDESNSTQ